MKKNLLFALSVFLITIVGLLVFSEASKQPINDSSNIETIEKHKENPNLASLNK